VVKNLQYTHCHSVSDKKGWRRIILCSSSPLNIPQRSFFIRSWPDGASACFYNSVSDVYVKHQKLARCEDLTAARMKKSAFWVTVDNELCSTGTYCLYHQSGEWGDDGGSKLLWASVNIILHVASWKADSSKRRYKKSMLMSFLIRSQHDWKRWAV
jgi:hypothetical protein